MPEQKDYYKIKAVSSHSLSYFEESPLTFNKLLNEELEQEDKKYLDFGKQVHMRILEPKLFKQSYTVLDYETPKSEQQKQFCEDYVKLYHDNPNTEEDFYSPSDDLIHDENLVLLLAYKNNYKTTLKDEKVLESAKELKDKLSKYIEYLTKRKKYKDILTFAKKQKIDSCYAETYKHKLANSLLFDAEIPDSGILTYNELEILWKHPVYQNIDCKSMIDRLVIDTNNKIIKIIDLKTTLLFKTFKESIYEFNYHRQMAFYTLAVYWYIKNILNMNVEDYTCEVYIVAIKHTPHQEVKVLKLDNDMLNQGLNEIETVMQKLAWHFESNQWEYSKEYYEGNGLDKLE